MRAERCGVVSVFSDWLPAWLLFADLVFVQIRPEQVCTPTDPGPAFMVVECPSEVFVEAVCSDQQLRR